MFFTCTDTGFIVRVRLTPNSSSCRVSEVVLGPNDEEYIKINIVAVPEKGKANKELIAYLSKMTGLAKGLFEIISGTTSHWKKVAVQTDRPAEEVLGEFLGEKK